MHMCSVYTTYTYIIIGGGTVYKYAFIYVSCNLYTTYMYIVIGGGVPGSLPSLGVNQHQGLMCV